MNRTLVSIHINLYTYTGNYLRTHTPGPTSVAEISGTDITIWSTTKFMYYLYRFLFSWMGRVSPDIETLLEPHQTSAIRAHADGALDSSSNNQKGQMKNSKTILFSNDWLMKYSKQLWITRLTDGWHAYSHSIKRVLCVSRQTNAHIRD